MNITSNTFTIDNTVFQISTEKTNNLTIRSHPTNYDVVFEEFVNTFSDKQVVLVDKKVRELYGITHTKLIEVEAIEENKCMDTVLHVCEQLLEYDFDRGHTLVVIGGGILQDIGAYVAKTFKRGIDWIYIPTTLLSQCDSCIGGKTALNFKKYKNQLALFSAPTKVIVDVSFLDTLEQRDILSGYGEIVKLFLIGGEFYVNNFDKFDINHLIFHSLSIKKSVVEKDEFELHERKSLNYGHSFGHAIESVTDYKISHGEGVLLGIEIINRLFTNSPTISNLVKRFSDFSKLVEIDVDKLMKSIQTDKKITNGIITFVVVTDVGKTTFVKQEVNHTMRNQIYALLIG